MLIHAPSSLGAAIEITVANREIGRSLYDYFGVLVGGKLLDCSGVRFDASHLAFNSSRRRFIICALRGLPGQRYPGVRRVPKYMNAVTECTRARSVAGYRSVFTRRASRYGHIFLLSRESFNVSMTGTSSPHGPIMRGSPSLELHMNLKVLLNAAECRCVFPNTRVCAMRVGRGLSEVARCHDVIRLRH